jgi:hypothetical protein
VRHGIELILLALVEKGTKVVFLLGIDGTLIDVSIFSRSHVF